MSSKAKTKGSAYERAVCKHLTGVFELNFERVPTSGAFTGGANAGRIDALTDSQLLLSEGDIIVPDELSHIKIECKAYKDFSFSSLFEKNSQFEDWVHQAREGTDRKWFLLFKINNKGQFIAHDDKLEYYTPGNYMIYDVPARDDHPEEDNVHCRVTTCKMFFEMNKSLLLEDSVYVRK